MRRGRLRCRRGGCPVVGVDAGHEGVGVGDEDALVVGRQDTVHLQADSVSCVDGIMLKDPAGKQLKADWKPVRSNELEVKLPLTYVITAAGYVEKYGPDERYNYLRCARSLR